MVLTVSYVYDYVGNSAVSCIVLALSCTVFPCFCSVWYCSAHFLPCFELHICILRESFRKRLSSIRHEAVTKSTGTRLGWNMEQDPFIEQWKKGKTTRLSWICYICSRCSPLFRNRIVFLHISIPAFYRPSILTWNEVLQKVCPSFCCLCSRKGVEAQKMNKKQMMTICGPQTPGQLSSKYYGAALTFKVSWSHSDLSSLPSNFATFKFTSSRHCIYMCVVCVLQNIQTKML